MQEGHDDGQITQIASTCNLQILPLSCSCIARLPTEIMGKISDHLQKLLGDAHQEHWKVIMLVCRTWRAIGVSSPFLWTRVDYARLSVQTAELAIQRAGSLGLHLRGPIWGTNDYVHVLYLCELCLRESDCNWDRQLNEEKAGSIVRRLGQAQSLVLQELTESSIPVLARQPWPSEAPRLQMAHFAPLGHQFTDDCWLPESVLACAYPQLRDLRIERVTFLWESLVQLHRLVNLKITWTEVENVSLRSILVALKVMPELETIDIWLNEYEPLEAITVEPAFYPSAELLHLKELRLRAPALSALVIFVNVSPPCQLLVITCKGTKPWHTLEQGLAFVGSLKDTRAAMIRAGARLDFMRVVQPVGWTSEPDDDYSWCFRLSDRVPPLLLLLSNTSGVVLWGWACHPSALASRRCPFYLRT